MPLHPCLPPFLCASPWSPSLVAAAAATSAWALRLIHVLHYEAVRDVATVWHRRQTSRAASAATQARLLSSIALAEILSALS